MDVVTKDACLIRFQRNASVPISRLPFEIVVAIFLYCQSAIKGLYTDREERHQHFSWIQVTHVCQLWRQVALNSPVLWRTIYICPLFRNSGSLGIEFVKRSCPLSLEVKYDRFSHNARNEEEEEFLDLYNSLGASAQRIELIHIMGNEENAIWALLDLPLPNLKSLSLLPYSDQNRYEFPVVVLQNTGIRRLSLKRYYIPAAVRHLLPPLTHLYLTDTEDRGDMTIKEFLDFLRSLSNSLEELYLHGVGPINSSYPTIDWDLETVMIEAVPTEMCRLRYVEIQDRHDSSEYCPLIFLRYLSLPTTIKLAWHYGCIHAFYTKVSLPPTAFLDRIKTVIIRRNDRGLHSLEGSTLFATNDNPNLILSMARCFPNLQTLVMGDFQRVRYAFHANYRSIRAYSTITLLHIDVSGYRNALQLIELLEMPKCSEEDYDGFDAEHNSARDVFPHLSNLTLYTGDRFISQYSKDRATKELHEKGLQGLDMDEDSRMRRERWHLKTSYTLCFRRGRIDTYPIDAFQ